MHTVAVKWDGVASEYATGKHINSKCAETHVFAKIQESWGLEPYFKETNVGECACAPLVKFALLLCK